MNNIYTVVPCRTYKVTATSACTLTDGHGLTLELTPGEAQTFEAKTSELHATLPVVLQAVLGGAIAGGGAAADGGSLHQPENREECDWVLIWRKDDMGTNASEKLLESERWAAISGTINEAGGICLPLGDYAVLVKRPPAWGEWYGNDCMLNIFAVFDGMGDLSASIRYYYFNVPGLES